MNFNCNVKVVDMLMGSGKTSAAINFMNSSTGQKFLFITPYLDEVTRIKEACPNLHFKEPKDWGSKMNNIKYLMSCGENIVSTHALFKRFDKEAIDICRANNYTLILDEVASVVEKYEIVKEDFEVLINNFAYIEESTGLLRWRADNYNGCGKFAEEKRLCELSCLAYYGGSIMMWLFPVEAFNAFRNIYILTYMFHAQTQKYYYDYYKLPYSYLYVEGDSVENYHFTEDENKKQVVEQNFKELIHILDDEKLNSIGDTEYDLSKNWYVRNKDNVPMLILKNHISNFFKNKRKTKSSENLWTTFSEFRQTLIGNGYGRSFVPLNVRASNKYRERTSIVYPVNRFINTGLKNFFVQKGIDIDEDGFAVSEMLQFIWRSAIREGKEIWIYVPSIRMRSLLQKWINENSKNNNQVENNLISSDCKLDK